MFADKTQTLQVLREAPRKRPKRRTSTVDAAIVSMALIVEWRVIRVEKVAGPTNRLLMFCETKMPE